MQHVSLRHLKIIGKRPDAVCIKTAKLQVLVYDLNEWRGVISPAGGGGGAGFDQMRAFPAHYATPHPVLH